jgi:hypothetical protein
MAQDPGRVTRGRPRKRIADKLVPLCTNVTPAAYDVLERRARSQGLRVSEFVRDLLSEEQETHAAVRHFATAKIGCRQSAPH